MPIFGDSHQTILDREATGILGTIRLDHPAGTFAPTPPLSRWQTHLYRRANFSF